MKLLIQRLYHLPAFVLYPQRLNFMNMPTFKSPAGRRVIRSLRQLECRTTCGRNNVRNIECQIERSGHPYYSPHTYFFSKSNWSSARLSAVCSFMQKSTHKATRRSLENVTQLSSCMVDSTTFQKNIHKDDPDKVVRSIYIFGMWPLVDKMFTRVNVTHTKVVR